MNKKIVILLLLISFISLFLNFYKRDVAPPCFNADEAAFGYNTYSLLKTGKDEYGAVFPLRLKSFGDYKLPMYSYLSLPFIGLFGLNETSTRFLNLAVSFFFPIVIFFLVQALFRNIKISILSSLLIALSPGLHIVGRHAHEAYLATFLISLAFVFFIKSVNKRILINYLLFSFFLLLALFTYQSSRIYAAYFLLLSLISIFLEKKLKAVFLLITIITLSFFLLTDVIYKPTRVNNLLFFNNLGFSLKINELRGEGGQKLVYNKAVIGLKDFVFEHMKYFSPQFLVINGDENLRFGFSGLSLLTPIEYFFIFIGLYFIFLNKERWRYALLGLVFISPLTSSLSWAGMSLTRSQFILIPLLIFSAYGFIIFIKEMSRNIYGYIAFLIIMSIFFLFLFLSWDFYLNHYPKRATVIRSWQCGYKELADYIRTNYQQYDRFYITRKYGQPYIFFLFYLQYQPDKYQKQASLSAPDEYGFGQVDGFDKFIFSFQVPQKEKKYVIIGSSDDFLNVPKDQIDLSKIQKKIVVGTEEIFWIYESDTN